MNYGLPQGYVKFGSLACTILRTYHEYGGMSHTDLVRTVDADPRHAATIVNRLHKLGYIFKQNRAGKYNTEFNKTEWIFGLTPNPYQHYEVKIQTSASRSARYRAKLRARRANSIFNMGKIDAKLLQSPNV